MKENNQTFEDSYSYKRSDYNSFEEDYYVY